MSLSLPLARYVQTLRHLTAKQWDYQLRHRLLRRRHPSKYARPELRVPTTELLEPIAKRAVLKEPLAITIFEQLVEVDDWSGAGLSDLQRYNLHYFDLCTGRSFADLYETLTLDWVANNPPLSGVGWDPFPISLRAVNWIKWHLLRGPLPEPVLESLCLQGRVLSARPEFHLLANHLLANAAALFHLGCFFSGTEAEQWKQQGRQLLDRAIDEQVLSDGGHFERSPMYHGLILEQLLDCVNVGSCFGVEIPSQWLTKLRSMLRWSSTMRHPDGAIPFFNDATFGVSPEHRELESYADRLNIERDEASAVTCSSQVLQETGFAVLKEGQFTVIADVGSPGPSYQPGHAHAGTLSFEVSVDEKRFLCNSGISTYARSQERLRQRGSSAHNCLVIDEANSSDVWSSFRVGHRACASILGFPRRSDVRLQATHDGYKEALHTRTFAISESKGLTIEDHLEPQNGAARWRTIRTPRRVAAYFHLHPSWEPSQQQDGVRCVHGDGTSVQVSCDIGSFRIVETSYHEGFGKSEIRQCLVLDWSEDSVSATVRFSCLTSGT